MPTSHKPRARRPSRPRSPRSSRSPAGLIIGAVVAVILAALAVAMIAGSGDDSADDTEAGADGSPAPPAATADVSVSGGGLPLLPDVGSDPAVGQPMPALSGTGFDGAPVSLPGTGRPALVMFVAHWCPHCQAEVPVVQRWVDDGGLPAGVDLVTVSTAADERRPNYPPADWLAGEGWTAPVLVDDAEGSAARAAGLTAFPFFVVVDADGAVAARLSGELTTAQLDEIVAGIAGAGS